MNFALLVSNLPDVYHVHHAQYAPQLPAHAPSLLKRMFSNLLTRIC